MPTGISGILYEITLPSGAIVTSQAGFGAPRPEGQTIVTEDGQVLA